MITERFRIVLAVVLLLYFSGIFYSLIRKYVLIKHTLIWLFAGVIMAVMVAFPGLLIKIAQLFGVYSDTNLLFMIMIGFILLINIYLTHIVMRLSESNRRLIQEVAILKAEMKNSHVEEKSV